MIIDAIEISGYKNLSNVKLDLSDITALVAPNGFGKSNVLEAFDFCMDFIKSPSRNKKTMMQYPIAIPINKYLKTRECQFKLKMTALHEEALCNVEYAFSFEWENDANTGAKIISEHLKIKLSAKPVTHISRSEDKALFKSATSGRCSSPININDDELVINKLMLHDKLFYYDIIQKINSLGLYRENRMDVENCFDPTPIRYRKLSSESLEMESIENIPRHLYKIKVKYPKKYEMLMHAFKTLFSNIINIDIYEVDIKNIRVERTTTKYESGDAAEAIEQTEATNYTELPFTIENKAYEMYITDENLNQSVPLLFLSEGSRRVLLLLTIVMSAEINKISVIALEEPENFIHPDLLQSLIRILSDFAGDCKILISSHSSHLIGYLKPGNVYISVPNSKGIASFSNIVGKGSKKIIDDASKYDQTLGDYIFSLLSGDDDDFEMIRMYMGV